MNTMIEASSECDDSSQVSTPTTSTPPTSTNPQATAFPITSAPNSMKRSAKSYGSLTEQLHHVKTFIKKTLKDDKADRLERKELDKVAIAKMRLGVDEYDVLLDALQKETGASKLEGSGSGSEDDKGFGGDGVAEEAVSREMDRIVSLRRQLASMRKRS